MESKIRLSGFPNEKRSIQNGLSNHACLEPERALSEQRLVLRSRLRRATPLKCYPVPPVPDNQMDENR
ncbi:MAG: hypothetical protein KGI54_18965 [Pseudomonadota bacterium]|nr:hypothetical protein [Pseudomonadota bacterium]